MVKCWSPLGVLIKVGPSEEPPPPPKGKGKGAKAVAASFRTKHDLFKAHLEREGFVPTVENVAELHVRGVEVSFQGVLCGESNYELIREPWEISRLLSAVEKIRAAKKALAAKKAARKAAKAKKASEAAKAAAEEEAEAEAPAKDAEAPAPVPSPSPSPSPAKPKPKPKPKTPTKSAKADRLQGAVKLASQLDELKAQGTEHLRQAAETLRAASTEPAMAGTALQDVVAKLAKALDEQAAALAATQAAPSKVVSKSMSSFPRVRASKEGVPKRPASAQPKKTDTTTSEPTEAEKAAEPKRPKSARGRKKGEKVSKPKPLPEQGTEEKPAAEGEKDAADTSAVSSAAGTAPAKKSKPDTPLDEPVVIMGKSWVRPFIAKTKNEEKAARKLSFRVPFK